MRCKSQHIVSEIFNMPLALPNLRGDAKGAVLVLNVLVLCNFQRAVI